MSDQNKTDNTAAKTPAVTADSRQAFRATPVSAVDAAQAKKDAEMARFIAAMPMPFRAMFL